jgi:hypothetical protein
MYLDHRDRRVAVYQRILIVGTHNDGWLSLRTSTGSELLLDESEVYSMMYKVQFRLALVIVDVPGRCGVEAPPLSCKGAAYAWVITCGGAVTCLYLSKSLTVCNEEHQLSHQYTVTSLSLACEQSRLGRADDGMEHDVQMWRRLGAAVSFHCGRPREPVPALGARLDTKRDGS